MESALEAMRRAGAVLIDSVKLPARQDLGGADYQVMLYEFKVGLNAYFASLEQGVPALARRALEFAAAASV